MNVYIEVRCKRIEGRYKNYGAGANLGEELLAATEGEVDAPELAKVAAPRELG